MTQFTAHPHRQGVTYVEHRLCCLHMNRARFEDFLRSSNERRISDNRENLN